MHTNNKILLEKLAKNGRSKVILPIEYFILTDLCWNVMFKFLGFRYFLTKQSSILFQKFTADQ